MLETIKIRRNVDIDARDLITPSDAARLCGRNVNTIVSMMNSCDLPSYELPQPEGVTGGRVQRYTSRKAVAALPKTARK